MVHTSIAVLLADALAFYLLGVVVVATHVCDQVRRPSAKLLEDDVHGSIDWSLLKQLVHFVCEPAHFGGLLLTSPWVKHHVSLDVASGFVVLSMANLPAEVRNQESRMADPADGIVEGLARRERLMAALVCKNP